MQGAHHIANILAVIDPTTSIQPGLQKAQVLAQALGARLHLLACETHFRRETRAIALAAGGDTPDPIGPEALLQSLAAPAREARLDVHVHVISGDPLYDELVYWLQENRMDLVVKDTHHHSFIRRTFLTNTDWQLIRGCEAPLLLTKQTPWPASPRFLAAIDPQHAKDPIGLLDLDILDIANHLARTLGSQMQVAHTFFPTSLPLPPLAGMPLIGSFSLQAQEAERQQRVRRLEHFIRNYEVPAGAVHVATGVAAQQLPSIADACRADVLVMGALARSFLRRQVIGATAERVLEHLPCDALLIKHHEHHVEREEC